MQIRGAAAGVPHTEDRLTHLGPPQRREHDRVQRKTDRMNRSDDWHTDEKRAVHLSALR
jgi:hypothetical protein